MDTEEKKASGACQRTDIKALACEKKKKKSPIAKNPKDLASAYICF